MKTIKSEFIGTDATGKDFFRVIIVSESAPDSFPTSGADVDGVPDTAGIAAGSVLLTPDGNSVLYTDGWQNTEALHITVDAEATMDKTWQEIKDAFDAGTTCLVDAPTWDPPIVNAPVTSVSIEDTDYLVSIDAGEPDDLWFVTNNANGHPVAD